MATLESLIPMVSMHVRNCPDPAITDALLRIAREFCKQTKWLRETLVRDVVGEQRIYDLESDTIDCEVFGVHAVQVSDQEPLTPAAFEESRAGSGVQAENWLFTPPARLWLNDVPYDDLYDGMAIRVYLQPTSTATTLPEELLRSNDRTIADGAIAWLCSMLKAGWSDPNAVAMFKPSYEDAKARSQLDSDNQFKPRNIRTMSYR